MIVAIDGPAASGKGTIARLLSAHFNLAYLDTGSLYRRVGFLVLEQGGDPSDEAQAIAAAHAISGKTFEDSLLRNQQVADAAARVAAIKGVRDALVDYQRAFGATPPNLPDGKPSKGAVVDGRDIGTVIFPDADVKLFITASAEERARRRHQELLERGISADFREVLSEVRARDELDATRPVSPLKQADDAHLLDTTDLSIEAAFEAARDVVAAAV